MREQRRAEAQCEGVRLFRCLAGGTSIAILPGMNNERLRVSPVVRASISNDGLVLLDVQGGMLLASNPIGARIWELIEQQRSRVEIAGQLAAEYDISVERAEGDVASFVADLSARGLVTEDPTC
jgi:hypothetical protein